MGHAHRPYRRRHPPRQAALRRPRPGLPPDPRPHTPVPPRPHPTAPPQPHAAAPPPLPPPLPPAPPPRRPPPRPPPPPPPDPHPPPHAAPDATPPPHPSFTPHSHPGGTSQSHPGFTPLVVDPGREVVLGVIGQWWRLGKSQDVPVDSLATFETFDRPGFAKGTFAFSLEEERGRIRLTTETRVATTSPDALRAFRPYWIVIRPGSGLIRHLILRTVRSRAQHP